ncbi:MAG: 16S rRNA processing protein RimM [Ruminococcaceae bacterium]|nr:16S rRNA processing protein RimM [Oscillospiraceae bacterium]
MRKSFIDAGEIVTTHGVRGEVKVLTWLDSPEMLCEFERCRIDGKEYSIEACRVQKNCNLLKLQGIDAMEIAQGMRGKVIQIYREDISNEVIFGDELIGVEVFSDEKAIGKITEVLDYPGNSVYVIDGGKYMIPAVKEFVLSTDIDKNVMQVKLIEGMGRDEN